MTHLTRSLAVTLLVGTVATPALAQGWGLPSNGRNQGIPPGQMPPAGQCRVWYDGVPPGQQPRPMNCRDAERLASRTRDARVIYGVDRRNENRSTQNRGGYGYGDNSVAYRNGYSDGIDKGREDARDRDDYDPVRHSRYRSADRGYNSRYGSKTEYKLIYRDGFEAGYREAYRQNGGRRNTNRW